MIARPLLPGALKALFAWLRSARDLLARWLARGAQAATRKKKQRRETDQRLRREDRRESVEADRK